MSAEACEQCRQPTIHKCEECKTRYCSGCEDQDHWSKCKSYEVCFSEKSGFYLKAVRDLFAGEIIFSEFSLVYGPIGDGRVPCVGCCRAISAEKISQCPKCSWPACSPNCEDLKNDQKHGLECKVLRLQKSDFRFQILLPLKILLLQITNKYEWEKLLKQTEDSCVKTDLPKFNNDTLKFLDENYLIPLKKEETGTILDLEEKSSLLLNKIFPHLKTTKFKPSEDIFVEIIFPTFSLIDHSCTPNSFQKIESTSNQYKITIRANSTITKNTKITSSSTDLFQGTYERQTDLKSSNISCSCSRCEDPTELDTFFSALKCLGTKKESCGGTQLPVEPTNPETLWVCDTCKIELPNDQIVKFVKHLGKQVVKILTKEASVEELEEFLAKLLLFLHPNHFYVCGVKHALVKLYGEDSILAKIDICKSLVEVLRKLCPNGGLLLGELLLELFQAKILGLHENCNGETKRTDLQELEELHQEIKTNVYVVFDSKLSKILAEEEAKLDSWLHQMSIT